LSLRSTRVHLLSLVLAISLIALIVNYLLFVLQSLFMYQGIELNSAAHVLAKEASFHCLDHVWLEETPYRISDVVLGEHVSP
jgi:hypothetical protein